MATAEVSSPVLLQKLPSHTEDEPAAAEQRHPPEEQLSDGCDAEIEQDWSDTESESSVYDSYLVEGDPEEFQYATEVNDDICTVEESRALKARLHLVGTNEFVMETLSQGTVGARKLCTAFGLDLPAKLRTTKNYYSLLGHLITRELATRKRLPQYTTLDDAAKLLKECNNIIVVTGAGISTSLGIPDFRSKESGFYTSLRELGHECPEDVFDLTRFDDDPKDFYSLAGSILPDITRCSPTHQFIRVLQDKGKLLTNYTQNIDNIETHAGISRDKVINCHGSWATATCRKCKYQVDGTAIFADVKQRKVAYCSQCIDNLAAAPRSGMKRKRSYNGTKPRKRNSDSDSDDDGRWDIPQPGVMKPDITFFGEALPPTFFDRIRNEDKHKVDLIIIIGTSMKVAPVSEIPQFIDPKVPQIYISRDPVRHINFDINLLGYADTICAELVKRAGWGELAHEMVPSGTQVTVTLANEEDDNIHKVVSTQPKLWLAASKNAGKNDPETARSTWSDMWEK